MDVGCDLHVGYTFSYLNQISCMIYILNIWSHDPVAERAIQCKMNPCCVYSTVL